MRFLSRRKTENTRDKYAMEESARRVKVIEEFVRRTNSHLEKRHVEGNQVWIIRLSSAKSPLPDQVLIKYVGELQRISQDPQRGGNCKDYSAAAVHKRITSGMFLGEEVSGFIGESTHAVGFDAPQNQSTVAVDWTAQTIDIYQGNYDLLILQADTGEELRKSLQVLYGGKWRQASKQEIETQYRLAYFDNLDDYKKLLKQHGYEGLDWLEDQDN